MNIYYQITQTIDIRKFVVTHGPVNTSNSVADVVPMVPSVTEALRNPNDCLPMASDDHTDAVPSFAVMTDEPYPKEIFDSGYVNNAPDEAPAVEAKPDLQPRVTGVVPWVLHIRGC